MKITQYDRERLVIIDFPYIFGIAFFCATILLAYYEIKSWMVSGHPIQSSVGLFLEIVFFFFCVAACVRRVFEFDLVSRQLRWKRQGLFYWKVEVIPFDQIKCAIVQCRWPYGTYLEYRVALATERGDIPLKLAYDVASNEECDQLRATINKALNITSPPEKDSQLLELSAGKQREDAIKAVAMRFELDPLKAQRMVDGGKSRKKME